MASLSLLLPAQMRFVLISAAPPGGPELENVLPPTNMTILKLSGIIQPNLLQDRLRRNWSRDNIVFCHKNC